MLKRLVRLLAQAVLPVVVLLMAYATMDALVVDTPPSLGQKAEDAEVTFAVNARDAALGDNRVTFRAFGEVVPAGLAELRVASPGEVVRVAEELAVGRVVDEGAALIEIDPFDYEGALAEARAQLAEARAGEAEIAARIKLEEAALAAAQNQLGFAERDLQRAQRLSTAGTLADRTLDERRLLVSERQQAVDQRTFTLEAELARLAQSRASIDRLAWQVRRAKRALEDTVLTAPFRGIVREENVEVGRLLMANDLAVSLIRADALDVAFTLSDRRFGHLIAHGPMEGREVEVTWRIGDTPITFGAVVTRVAPDIAADTGGVRLYARFSMPQNGPVPRPGAFVEVRVPGPVHADSLRLPTPALYDDAVFVIAEDERLKRRPVRVLGLEGEEVIVRGVREGDAVVVTRIAEAGEGLRVKRVDEDPTVALPEDVAEGPDAADETSDEQAPASRSGGAAERSRS